MRIPVSALVLAVAVWPAGCGFHPPLPETVPRPSEVLNFGTLYQQNCSACHGRDGSDGPAIDLANPEYEALIDDATLRKWIAVGMPETQMPAFAQSNGGMLTDAQVNAIVAGMRRAWSRPNAFSGAVPPPYAQTTGGDAQRGAKTYQERCAICHANSRQQIASPAYLALVGDQSLRSFIIAGSPDIGQPDWHHDSQDGNAAAPLSAQEVNNVIAYLASQRSAAANVSGNSPSPAAVDK